MDWAHHIKDLRRTRGIATQAELAEMVGVDPVTVSRWETGQHQPDILYRRRLLDLTRSRDGGADRAIIAAARQAPGAVALLDAGGDVAITASQELCRLQGLSYAEYIQTNWRGRYSDMAEIALKTPVIERMLLCGEIVAITVCSRASSVKGATYCVNAVFFPVWLSAGEMIMRLSAVTSPDDQFSGPGIDFIAREEV